MIFLSNESFNNKGYKTYIPISLMTTKEIIHYIEKEILEEELTENLESPVKILNAKRLNRRILDENRSPQFLRSTSVVLKFQRKHLPSRVNIYYYSFPVNPYIAPVIQCRKCLIFGQIAKQCRGKARYAKYTEEHSSKLCQSLRMKCYHCEQSLCYRQEMSKIQKTKEY